LAGSQKKRCTAAVFNVSNYPGAVILDQQAGASPPDTTSRRAFANSAIAWAF